MRRLMHAAVPSLVRTQLQRAPPPTGMGRQTDRFRIVYGGLRHDTASDDSGGHVELLRRSRAGSSETFEGGHASLTANRLTPHWFKSRGRDLGWHWSST